jgi:AsmA protein
MRPAKIIGGILGGIAVILGIALLLIWLTVDPNNYKDRIAAAVRESTGRELKLSGAIKLSVFPGIALELGPASLGNPPGFDDQPFLSFTHADLKVELWPLLRRRLEVSRIELDGLDVRMRRNPAGKGNWQVATNPSDTATSPPRTSHSSESVGRIRVKNGRVSYANLVVENIMLDTGSMAGREVPVTMSFSANRGKPGEVLILNGKFNLSQAPEQESMRFAAVSLAGSTSHPGDAQPVSWDLAIPELSVNLTQQTLAAPAFELSYSGGHLHGGVAATKMLDDLSATGSVTLAPVVPREFLVRFGVELPQIRDPKALAQLSASTDFDYGAKGLSLEKLQVSLDETQLQGGLRYSSGDTVAITFDLSVDRVDLDRYRAPEGAASRQAPQAKEKPGEKATVFEMAGTLRVGAARFSRLDFTNLKVTVTSKERVTHLFPIESQIDGGRYSGDITWDQRGTIPALSVDEHLMGIDMARLLAGAAQKNRLSGHATLSLKASARGASLEAMLKTLDGHLDANLAAGAIEGIDLTYDVNVAQALINRAAPTKENSGRTPFEAFKVSAQITHGVAETHDLMIASQALQVTGQGTANLSTRALNLQLQTSILTAPSAKAIDIPVTVTGTYVDPSVKPDVEALAKGELKQKLRDVLKKNGLQGLFTK